MLTRRPVREKTHMYALRAYWHGTLSRPEYLFLVTSSYLFAGAAQLVTGLSLVGRVHETLEPVFLSFLG